MHAGCMKDDEYSEEDIDSCKRGRRGVIRNDGFDSWCCRGEQCSRELYQKHVFSGLQEVRLKEEDGYLGLVYNEMAQKSEHVWATDKLYYESQPIFESIMYAFTTIYLIGLYFIYATYKPKDMHKLPPLPRKKPLVTASSEHPQ